MRDISETRHRRQADYPLGFHWRPINEAAFDALGLPSPATRDEAATRLAVLTESFVVGRAWPDRFISYSRRQAFYAEPTRYRRTSYSYLTVVRTIDLLDRHGLIEHDRAHPGRLGWQSRFRPTRALIVEISRRIVPVIYDPCETLLLRDRAKNPVTYRDTKATRAMRRRIAQINEALRSISVSHPTLGEVLDGDPVKLGAANVGPARRTLCRLFTTSFSLHGRFYGPWWQNIPKAERSHLQINGQPTFEADLPSWHISLAYVLAGKRLCGDPYQIEGWSRDLVKLATNVALNARDRTAALRAVVHELQERDGFVPKGVFGEINRLLDAVEHRHAPVRAWFYADAGMTLMNADSAFVEDVVLNLIKQGVVALPLHDSFRVEAAAKGTLLHALLIGLEALFGRGLTYCDQKEKGQNVPHNGGRDVEGCGSKPSFETFAPLVLVLPAALGQGDLFPTPVSVSVRDVFGWSGGVAPPGVRNAVRREMHRRCLRQEDAAREIGVSRPALANILKGRFGASAEVAQRVRQFIVSAVETVRVAW
jgi:DNA-binding XRE family transcriptional regulator